MHYCGPLSFLSPFNGRQHQPAGQSFGRPAELIMSMDSTASVSNNRHEWINGLCTSIYVLRAFVIMVYCNAVQTRLLFLKPVTGCHSLLIREEPLQNPIF